MKTKKWVTHSPPDILCYRIKKELLIVTMFYNINKKSKL